MAARSAAPHIEADSGSGPVAVTSPPSAGDERAEPPPVDEPLEAATGAPEVSYGIFEPDASVVLSPEVEAHIREVARRVPGRRTDVFVKIGDSATVSRAFMRCFAEDDELVLEGRDELRPAIERIRRARVAGRSSFTRESRAAVVGRSVHQLMRGSPSPVVREVRELSPRFALVMFGGNDIEIGRLDLYGTQMLALVDLLLQRGVIPILSTIPPRGDDPVSNREVPRYDAVVEAIAAARRVPIIDLNRAMASLPRQGLARDGVHPNAPVVDGRARACDFSAHGLEYGMNVRNLLTMRTLARLFEVLDRDEDPAAAAAAPTGSDGPASTTIDRPRFAVVGTTRGGSTDVDRYEGCSATQSEAGPERRYALRLEEAATVRARVMYGGDVDVDVHLLRNGVCVARGDSTLEVELEAGEYEIVVDTFESERHAGDYVLLVER